MAEGEVRIDGCSGGGTITPHATAEGARVRAILVTAVAYVALAACGGPIGTLPRVADVAPSEGHKMLRPAQVVTVCDGGSLKARAGEEDLLSTAFHQLLTRDHEANLVINAHVES